jgi:outer membrane protein assembly factor BamB
VRNRTDGSLLTTLPVDGAACGLAIADGRVLVSTDRGVLHCFASGESREAVETTESATIAEETSEQEDADPLHLVAGPHVRHLAPDSVEISWQVGDIRSMSVQILEAGSAIQELAAQTTLWGDDPASHSVAATGLKLSSEYAFRITATDPDGSLSETQAFTLDAACDVPARPAPQGEPVTKTADLVAGLPHVDENTVGYALLLGDDATLAIELARQTMLQSIVVEPDVAKAAATRTKLADAGIHGTRAVVHCAPLNQLPYASRSINLIVVQPSRCGIEWSSDVGVEMARVCRPSGAVCFPKTEDLQGAEEHLKSGTRLTWYGGGWCRLGWRKLEQRGQWSHLYCDPSGKASSSETLRAPLQIQWFGRPGPKHMIDRHHRGMSPLVVDGRIFLPGNERLKGVDAYNGTILWDLTMPGFRRVAMMRDSGHLAAQENEVFAVIRNGCRVIDAASGRWLRTLALPESENACPKYWGYLAVIDDAVLGTAEIAGASYDQHEREIPARVSYWDNVPVVTGKTLFSLDRKTGKPRWIYRNPEGSVLLHSTIVADNGCVFFVESRAPEAIADSDGRVTLEMACVSGASWLVALDLASGKELWEHLVELPEIRNVLHAVCAEDTVVLAGTQNEERHPRYDLLAFNASNGSPRWATHYLLTDKEPNGDHGEQDQHPVVIGRTLYTRPWAFDVLTGEKLDFQLDRGGHGCGGLSGSACYLFGRGRNPRIYDLDPGVQSGMPVTQVTRPGCWINMIAADGLLLIPEGSSGCSCAFSIQTSLGLAPIQER